jgi:hypothetical protein
MTGNQNNEGRRSTIPPPQGEEAARRQRSLAGHKGGAVSSQVQRRDSFGQFAGRSEGKPPDRPQAAPGTPGRIA